MVTVNQTMYEPGSAYACCVTGVVVVRALPIAEVPPVADGRSYGARRCGAIKTRRLAGGSRLERERCRRRLIRSDRNPEWRGADGDRGSRGVGRGVDRRHRAGLVDDVGGPAVGCDRVPVRVRADGDRRARGVGRDQSTGELGGRDVRTDAGAGRPTYTSPGFCTARLRRDWSRSRSSRHPARPTRRHNRAGRSPVPRRRIAARPSTSPLRATRSGAAR